MYKIYRIYIIPVPSDSCDLFTHILQDCFTGHWESHQCQWGNSERNGQYHLAGRYMWNSRSRQGRFKCVFCPEMRISSIILGRSWSRGLFKMLPGDWLRYINGLLKYDMLERTCYDDTLVPIRMDTTQVAKHDLSKGLPRSKSKLWGYLWDFFN